MNLYSKLNDYTSVDDIFQKVPKSVKLYETYTKILKIKDETNEKENQILQEELNETSIESIKEKTKREYIEKMKFGRVIEAIEKQGEK